MRAATEPAATGFAHADHALVKGTVNAVRDVEMTADERLVPDMLLAGSLWGEMEVDASVRLIDRSRLTFPKTPPRSGWRLGWRAPCA